MTMAATIRLGEYKGTLFQSFDKVEKWKINEISFLTFQQNAHARENTTVGWVIVQIQGVSLNKYEDSGACLS